MKLRSRHKGESEVFTDTLVDILFILLMFFLIVSTAANPNVVKVHNPQGTKDVKAKQNIVVSIGQRKIDPLMFDSLLTLEIRRLRPLVDTPTVVINADTSSFYGHVFRVMRIAKRDTAKVVANVH
jgi:biopolymer transport protein ExbD